MLRTGGLMLLAAIIGGAVSAAACSGGTSVPPGGTPADPSSLLRDALLNPDQLGNDWELIPPLKPGQDSLLTLTCTVEGKVQQATIDTTYAAKEHFAGRRAPLIRPQFSETIAVLPDTGVADYMTRVRNCNSQSVADFATYGDETVFRHVSRPEPDYVDSYDVVVRRGNVVLSLGYSIYQSDLYDARRIESLVRLADDQLKRIATQLQ